MTGAADLDAVCEALAEAFSLRAIDAVTAPVRLRLAGAGAVDADALIEALDQIDEMLDVVILRRTQP